MLNLAYFQRDIGELTGALADLTKAEEGLARVSGESSAVVQGARYGRAGVFHALGRHAEALQLIERIDAKAFGNAISGPGAGGRLAALKGRILIALGRVEAGVPMLAQAVESMERDGMPAEELTTVKEILRKAGGR
ncbi:MAG: hypothetical protein ACT4QA_01045 [Panacagrimonas sp.]